MGEKGETVDNKDSPKSGLSSTNVVASAQFGGGFHMDSRSKGQSSNEPLLSESLKRS